jgi:hypothetical protein
MAEREAASDDAIRRATAVDVKNFLLLAPQPQK